MNYYTAIAILVWTALIVLSILAAENSRLTKAQKRVLFITYAVVALATLSEWLGVLFSTNPAIPFWQLKLVKLFDYILTPICGGIIVLQLKNKTVCQKIIFGVLIANTIFQIIAYFFDWMTKYDAEKGYAHGSLYYVYVGIYCVILILTVVEFALYGRKYRRHNRVSLHGILVYAVVGIALQEIFSVRTAYIAIVIGLAFLFIHNVEFAQQDADNQIQEQMIQITIDPLTGILNRYAYEEALREVKLTEDFVVISIDINGLKMTNDTYGHKAGDELICGAANVIADTFNAYGKCYRIGGDEFIVLAEINRAKLPKIIKQLEKKTSEWRGEEISYLSLSTGYAPAKDFDLPSIDDLVSFADLKMYKNKSDYYLARGIDRRRQL